jgi:hypothetical protein
MSLTTTDSISGKGTPVPQCAECKQKRPGILYTMNANGQPVCEPCSGRPAQVIRVITDED